MQLGKRYSRLAAVGVSGVAVAALVAGCGGSSGNSDGSKLIPSGGTSASAGGGSDSSPHALLAASVAKTEAAKNAMLHIDVKASSGGQSFDFGGDGIIDFAGKKFQLVLDLPSGTGISGTIEERVIDGVVYMKLPSAAAAGLGGKSWIKIDTAQLGGGSTSSSLGALGQDPTQFLGTLRSVSDSVTKVGTEEIRGVKTTHYRAEVDLAKAAKAGGSTDAASIEQYQKVLGSSTLPEDVYIDDKGLARRFSVTVKAPATATGTDSGSFSTTVDLYDFGTSNTAGIVAPPASEVGSLPSGIKLGG